MSATESSNVKLVILNSGQAWRTKAPPGTKISKLLSLAVTHFQSSGMPAIFKSSSHKLVAVRTRKVLPVERSIDEEGLRDNDEIMLIECQTPPKRQANINLSGPTLAEINDATKHLQAQNIKIVETAEEDNDLSYSDRFSMDSARIFLSLVEVAGCLLAFAPSGREVLNILKKELASRREPVLHGPNLKQLTDMGFSEQMASKALIMKQMNVTEAAEWLVEQGSSSKTTQEQKDPSVSQPENLTVYDEIQKLLRSALMKRKENFTPNLKYVQKLKKMGYDENKVEDALRETDNHMKAAISLLSGKAYRSSAGNDTQRLNPDGNMFKALMASDIVQLQIRKPKFLYALLSLLEDPSCLSIWLKDHEVSLTLNQIMMIHNTESSGGRSVV